MKKKTRIAAILLLAVMLPLCGCSKISAEQGEIAVIVTPEPTQETLEEETAPDPEEEISEDTGTDAEVPENMTEEKDAGAASPDEREISITIPPEYAGTTYPVGEIILSMNGSVTYRLTEEEYGELLRLVHDTIQNELDAMCQSPYFLHFDSMTANEDCTSFEVVVNDIETSKAEQKSIQQIYDFGRMYAAYQGREPGNIHIDFMTHIGNTFVTRDSEKDFGTDHRRELEAEFENDTVLAVK